MDSREEGFQFVLSCRFLSQVKCLQRIEHYAFTVSKVFSGWYRETQHEFIAVSLLRRSVRKHTDKSLPEKNLDCTVQSRLKTTKPIKVVLEQEWKKTFNMAGHSRQSKDLLIHSLILILLYYMGLNFLVALACVQIKPGIRRSKVFLLLL